MSAHSVTSSPYPQSSDHLEWAILDLLLAQEHTPQAVGILVDYFASPIAVAEALDALVEAELIERQGPFVLVTL
jgi:hypothetical protein